MRGRPRVDAFAWMSRAGSVAVLVVLLVLLIVVGIWAITQSGT